MEMPLLLLLVVMREEIPACIRRAVDEREVLVRPVRCTVALHPYRPGAVHAVEVAAPRSPAMTVVPREHRARVVEDLGAEDLEARQRAEPQRRILRGMSEDEIQHRKSREASAMPFAGLRQQL